MKLSDIISVTLEETGTPLRTAAGVLGLSPQNFGQRLRRDSLTLENVFDVLAICGANMRITVSVGDYNLIDSDIERGVI